MSSTLQTAMAAFAYLWDSAAVILGTLFGSRPYQTYSGNIVRNEHRPGFKASLGLKDLRLASEAAEQAGRTLPMLAAVHGRTAETVEAGMGDRDWSAMAVLTVGPGAVNPADRQSRMSNGR